MDSLNVQKIGKKYIPNLVGVFPLNKLPQALHAPANLIVNTDTHNLPGEHWLGVSYQKDGTVYAFDSFGFFYPRILRVYFNKIRRTRPVIYNRIHYQSIHEQTCALYCIAWLITINNQGYQNTGYKHK